ncbi:D-2-hydroxyacid dehydrogenase [Cohnella massiliensis]|uniref:D-2-hydroxyacid dehydrogenase n=1 Tax=Cohnella massiliensis TaxID=1816691 RepID=UPI0009BC3994|nr:D-2-hydroxyacid dehydrogenase [Cohnella massiliensis]
MRTLVGLSGFTPKQEERIRSAVPGWNVVFGKAKELGPGIFREAEVICGWAKEAEADLLRPDAKLRWVQAGSAGVDYLPLKALEQKGAVVTDASGVHPVPMAETAFAMMLAFGRKLHLAVRKQAERKWEPLGAYGELRGKTLGIVGAGAIGEETARIAQAFGMRVLGLRRSGRPAPYFDRMSGPEGLDDLLAESDYVVNILPHTERTVRLFDAESFARMKPTACFINVGRGSAVDTAALTEALAEGRIAGAGLDVFEKEPLPDDHPLWSMDNVILTPHMGGLSERYKDRLAELFADNLLAYAASGRPARNIVDYGLMY